MSFDKFTLYPHQIDALKQTEGLPNCAFYLDMGLGKTFVGSEAMKRYGNKVNLIVCQKSKVSDWVEHFKKYYSHQVFNLTKPKELRQFTGVVLGEKYIVYGIINYELLWRRSELMSLKDFTLMLDESSLIQNRHTRRSKCILQMRPKNTILLSGTPTSGKYENLWSQMHLLGWPIKETTYNAQYVNWESLYIGEQLVRRVRKDHPYKNVDRLKAKMREYGSVFLKTEECIDLPKQVFQMIKVPQTLQYKRFKRDKVVIYRDEEITGSTELEYRLHLRQFCGMYSKPKIEAFTDILNSTNDRLIVFYNFNEELNQLKAAIGSIPYSVVNGGEKDLTAYETCDDSVTFVQYQAGAMGLNLQKANRIVYFTPPDGRSDLFDQSLKRIHRIGQDRTCFYYLLTTEDSVETEIYEELGLRTERTNYLFEEVSNG